MIEVVANSAVALIMLERAGVYPDQSDFLGMAFIKNGIVAGAAGLDCSIGGIASFAMRHEAAVHFAGKGCWTRKSLSRWFSWAFDDLGFKRLSAQNIESNFAAVSASERIGFVREGVRRGAGPLGENVIMYGCLPSDRRF
ncbi:MAG: GNAT family N-acetyltransferase [Paracoccaceae bacterium]